MKKKILIFSIAIFIVLIWVILLFNKKTGDECEKYDKNDPIFSNARDTCYANIARESQNSDLCNQIKSESTKKLCLVHVYYWDKSVEFCEKDDQKNICLHVISIKSRDRSICARIDNDSIKKLCEQE